MPITRLEVIEYVVNEEDAPVEVPAGYKYSHFVDPLTGKYYRPRSSFFVTGDNLEDLFEEVKTDKAGKES